VILELLRARAQSSPDDALRYVTSAVELASSYGLLQTVVSDGRQLMDVIERAAWRVPAEWLHRLRLAMAPTTIPDRPSMREFLEPLTERERDVLRLLPSRLTLSEIAKELYVSVNTLKFHLRVIYRKLGVNSREEAAAVARSMTTVPPTSTR
jgi:LuxR family maltose regulon positive regulatory protein